MIKQIIKVVLLFIGIFLLLEVGFLAYSEVFEPAYVSVMSSCNIRSAESFGYSNSGTFTYGSKNESENGIKIVMPRDYSNEFNNNYLINRYMESRKYKLTMKHEKCHENQYLKNRIGSCNNKIRLYFNEVECYISQYL